MILAMASDAGISPVSVTMDGRITASISVLTRAVPAEKLAVRWLAAATIGASAFSVVPAIWDIVEYVQFLEAPGSAAPARWALLLLLIGCVESAYAMYLIQLPDWASVRVVTWML